MAHVGHIVLAVRSRLRLKPTMSCERILIHSRIHRIRENGRELNIPAIFVAGTLHQWLWWDWSSCKHLRRIVLWLIEICRLLSCTVSELWWEVILCAIIVSWSCLWRILWGEIWILWSHDWRTKRSSETAELSSSLCRTWRDWWRCVCRDIR